MTIQPQHPTPRPPKPHTPTDPDAARLLTLLQNHPHHTLTIATIRAHGITTPAQNIYTLQLAGYDIDRAPPHENPNGPPGYRLNPATPHTNQQPNTPDTEPADTPRPQPQTPSPPSE